MNLERARTRNFKLNFSESVHVDGVAYDPNG